MTKIIEDVLVFLLVYYPPLVLFVINIYRDLSHRFIKINKKQQNVILVLICIVAAIPYLGLVIFTQNLVPFILVLLNLRYLKKYSDGNNEIFIETFNFKNFKVLKALGYSFISYILTFNSTLIMVMISSILKLDLKQQDIIFELSKLPLKKFLLMLPVMLIFAPVVEEFIFRWLLFKQIFMKKVNIYISAILSSMIFAVAHFNAMSFLIIFTVGMFNCYLIHKKGYWYAVFNHMIFNSVTAVIMLVQKLH